MKGTWVGNVHIDHEDDVDPKVVEQIAKDLEILAAAFAAPSSKEEDGTTE